MKSQVFNAFLKIWEQDRKGKHLTVLITRKGIARKTANGLTVLRRNAIKEVTTTSQFLGKP